jgi:hypothetical protein
MKKQTKPQPFSLGICMAGAVSAGAYTAGVMDYLLEALEAYEQKRGTPGFPSHKVVIPVIGGASAGGMTSIITAAAMQQGIKPIDLPGKDLLAERPENILYHSWVDLTEEDMFAAMLETDDIKDGDVVSAFNCAFIDKVAERTLIPPKPDSINWKERPGYLAEDLKLFTTLSNLQGYSYDVNFKSADAGEHRPYYMQMHNDYACFQLTWDQLATAQLGWLPLNIRFRTNTSIAIEAAMATGAFPVGLKARTVTRPAAIVNNNQLFDKKAREAIKTERDPYQTLNIDGGMINNEPFDKVRGQLAKVTGQNNPKEYENFATFKSTVLMIAPFPSEKPSVITMSAKLLHIIGLTLSAMISQMRSKPSEINDALNDDCAGQFLIDPSRAFFKANGEMEAPVHGERAIACGALGGFSGFLNKEFRVHDYFLGRYNCKIFLRDYFTIPDDAKSTNPIFSEGYAGISGDKYRSTVDKSWQIIPIVEDVNYTFPEMKFSGGSDWPTQQPEAIDRFQRALAKRLQAIVLNIVKFKPVLKFFLWLGVRVVLRGIMAKTVLKVIKTELQTWHLMKKEGE